MLETELGKLDLCDHSIQEMGRAGGYFERLPADDSVLNKIVGYLPNTDILNMRTLSSWFVLRVTQSNQMLFTLYNIKDINEDNCDCISATLAELMARDCILNKQLKLQFSNLNGTTQEMMSKYRSSIISLDVCIIGDVGFLFQPNLIFDQLESLSITFKDDHSDDRAIIECLVSKHADKLQTLKLDGFICEDLTLPKLQKCNFLSLKRVQSMFHMSQMGLSIHTRHLAVWSLFKACKPTRLEVEDATMYHTPDFAMLQAQAVPFHIQEVDSFDEIDLVNQIQNNLPGGNVPVIQIQNNQPGANVHGNQMPNFMHGFDLAGIQFPGLMPGFDPPVIQIPGFNPAGDLNLGLMPGFAPPGNQIQGFNQGGNQIQGFDQPGNQIQGFNQAGNQIQGFDQPGNQIQGFNQAGNQIQGFDPVGHHIPNPPGNQIQGFNPGFDLAGNQIEGIDLPNNQNPDLGPEMEFSDAIDIMVQQTLPGVDLSGYKIPNLKTLKMTSTSSSCYIYMNAYNLVSLTMRDIILLDMLPGIIFPNLRELNIDGSYRNLLSFLAKCQDSLECLVYTGARSLDSYLEFYRRDIPVMPRLTDLYLHNTESCRKFISYHHRSLEFLYLDNVSPLHSLEDNVNMENMKTVVIKHSSDEKKANMDGMQPNQYQDVERAEMERMCPSANVIVWNKDEKKRDDIENLARARHHSRGFATDILSDSVVQHVKSIFHDE